MGAMADPFQKISNRIGVKRLALVGAAVLITLLWLYLTPQGLLGKADAIGYAVCHRIDTRSFYLGDRQIPLCARCSGMYLGVLAGFLYQLRLGKRSHFPPKPILVAFGLLGLAFALDGLNSYLTLFPGYTPIYPPNNALRLATGTGLGLLIAVVLMPVVNQTLWLAPVESPLIHRWVQLPGLVIAAGLPAAALASENPILLYPLALLSSAAVVGVLGLCFALLWVILLKKENTFNTWREAWPMLLSGFITAMVQIGIIDILRFSFTGSWGGFQF